MEEIGREKGTLYIENRGIGYTNIYRCMEWCLENNAAYESIHCSSHLYTTIVKWCMNMTMMSTLLRVTNPIHTHVLYVCMYMVYTYICTYIHTYIYGGIGHIHTYDHVHCSTPFMSLTAADGSYLSLVHAGD